MFEFKSIPQHELAVIFRNASQKTGLNEVILEKDYWVCFVLNYLFSQCKWHNDFTFKGGTSLSKCFHLIQRFSEDIDLILDWRMFGYQKDEPWNNRSNTQQDKFNKEINSKTEYFLKDQFVPQMKHDFKDMLKAPFHVALDETDHQTVLFEYPKVFKSSYIVQMVRLEIGTLAAWSPAQIVPIEPEIRQAYPMLFDGDAIRVRTVQPERTFWEKATILHHEAHRPKEKSMPNRYARHYYDLVCIAQSQYKEKAFSSLELLDKVVMFKQKFYPTKWAKYEEARVKTIKLMPNESRLKEIEADYKNMEEMFFGTHPTFNELVEKLLDLEKEIHNLE